jgi:hypothetical protein
MNLKRSLAALAFAVAVMPVGVQAQERVGDAALGAVSGALVLGPIGAVAGAVVGYTAGPNIANAWRMRRSQRVHHTRSVKHADRATEIASRQSVPLPPARTAARPNMPSDATAAQIAPQGGVPAPSASAPAAAPGAPPSAPSFAAVPVQGFE